MRVRKSHVRRGVSAVLGLGAVVLVGAAASGAPDPTYPNMPAAVGQIRGAITDTIAMDATAQQWIRVPELTVAADIEIVDNFGPPGNYCLKKYGDALCTKPADAQERATVGATVYPLTSAKPITDSTFTSFPATTVRMLAFGAIPVQATLHLSLPVDADGLPEGLVARNADDLYPVDLGPAAHQYPPNPASPGLAYAVIGDSTIKGAVDVRISDVTVDGEAVDVGDHCHTTTPATLTGTGHGYVAPPDDGGATVPDGDYNPQQGGTFNATLDVPAFSGCGVGGDRLDPLFSAMASGTGFPVTVVQGDVGGCISSPPSTITDTCGTPNKPSFPPRTK